MSSEGTNRLRAECHRQAMKVSIESATVFPVEQEVCSSWVGGLVGGQEIVLT